MTAYIIWQESINPLQARYLIQELNVTSRRGKMTSIGAKFVCENSEADSFIYEYYFSANFNQMLGETWAQHNARENRLESITISLFENGMIL